MKKTFPLHQPDRADARVIEAIKNEVRKYLKRERRKALPEGFTQWDFNCRVGADATTSSIVPVDDLIAFIDATAAMGGEKIYIEILAAPGQRPARPDSQV